MKDFFSFLCRQIKDKIINLKLVQDLNISNSQFLIIFYHLPSKILSQNAKCSIKLREVFVNLFSVSHILFLLACFFIFLHFFPLLSFSIPHLFQIHPDISPLLFKQPSAVHFKNFVQDFYSDYSSRCVTPMLGYVIGKQRKLCEIFGPGK